MSTMVYFLTFANASPIFMATAEAVSLPALLLSVSFSVFLFRCRCWCEINEGDSVEHRKAPRCSRGGDSCSSFCFCGIEVCAGRRKRFKKCAKRCEKRKKGSSHVHPEGCWVAKNFKTAFAKLHLPPPLPYHRKRSLLELKCEFEHCDDSSEESQETASVDPNLMPMNSQLYREGSLSDVSLSHSTSSAEDTIDVNVSTPGLKPAIQISYPRSRSALMDMVRMQQWQFIIDHPAKSILLGRKQAKHHDSDGLYPLHWACSGGPPSSIVEALIQSYPSATRKRDHEGSTPLHFATHYSASVPVIEKLLLVHPEAVSMQDKYGRTPLYHAIEKSANINVIQALIRADKTTTVISCLPKELRDIHKELGKYDGVLRRAISVRTPLFLAWTAVLGDAHARKTFQGKKWDKAVHLLMAAYETISTSRPLVTDQTPPHRVPPEHFLRAAITLDIYLPDAVVPIAIKSLAVAASKSKLRDDPSLYSGAEFLAAAAETEQYSEQRSTDVIRMIIEAFPFAASHSTDGGRSPLGIAAAAGKLWKHGAMDLIFAAAPDAVSQADPLSGLPPFMLAAVRPEEAKEYTVDVLRAKSLRLWLEKNDPYNLLTRKDRQREQQPPVTSQEEVLKQGYETAKLETIYQLIQSDPTVLSHCLRQNALSSCFPRQKT
ncbi:hypothetical protein FisN_2Hh471 [Fistulifera solaris]|uniref:Uncharacterized protein n=1 Tax=Fistulifera solaris TaxID=1519565 RepID=A0A1Z5JGU0_FISSO|nr:hypothetical protein FisN_2Hh471 [Fistulifera solaris]|eukprot:GAX12981.1 hypothetical protein FisN_2Hh471 [Fistulifera solaris]